MSVARTFVLEEFAAHSRVIEAAVSTMADTIVAAADHLITALGRGNKVLLFGNGGSAADSQHIAAELVGRYRVHRRGLPAIALNVDTSALTAIANDFGYAHVFERQVEALARPGDVAIGITTSGSSANVLWGLAKARAQECTTIALTGSGGAHLMGDCTLVLAVPSSDTARIQEVHAVVGHVLCALVEQAQS